MNNINYQQIYEDEVNANIKDSLEKPSRFHDLSSQERMFIEDLIDIGYQRAIDDALDPTVLEEMSELSIEMGAQLTSLAEVLKSYISKKN